MCGLVLYGSDFPSEAGVSLFEKLLFADTFRGPHSTGVMTHRKHNIVGRPPITTIPVLKKEGIAPDFLRNWSWNNILRDGPDPAKYTYGDFYIGHNRYATQGAVNTENAHPFTHGNITLVHNGTLMDVSTLPDFAKFEVDSENICHSINKIGAKATIELLDGAFTLIWHDAKDDTLHIIRNDERPFHLARTANSWFGASEELMLKWILGRDTKTYIQESFEIAVGEEYVFDTSYGFKFKEKITRNLLDPYYGMGWGLNSYHRGTYRQPVSKQPVVASTVIPFAPVVKKTPVQKKRVSDVDTLLEQHRLPFVHGQIISFCPFSREPYDKEVPTSRNKVRGYLDTMEYIEVECHAVEKEDYNTQGHDMTGKIVGAYEKIGTLYIICTFTTESAVYPAPVSSDKEVCDSCDKEGPTPFTISTVGTGVVDICQECYIQYGKDAPPFLPSDEQICVGGIYYTEAEWTDLRITNCGCCDEEIAFSEADDCEVFGDSPICKSCDETMALMHLVTEPIEDEFVCSSCAETYQPHMESDSPKVCAPCYESFHDIIAMPY
jgi:hypothetical protein